MVVDVRAVERFHFWGDYSASVFVICPSLETAEQVLRELSSLVPTHTLRHANGKMFKPLGWQLHKPSNTLAIWAGGKDLDQVHAQLKAHGADIDNLTSMRSSVDSGPVIHFSMTVKDPESEDQLLLDL